MTSPRMRPHHWLFSALMVAGVLWMGLAWSNLLWAKPVFDGTLLGPPEVDVIPARDPLYLEECGGCHFAYPPGLMPARGWDKIMSSLDDHFGDDAELLEEDYPVVAQYLLGHAADTATERRSIQITRASAGYPVPRRISELPYVKDAHRDVPIELVDDNPEVGGAAHCDACHVEAGKGYYNDSNVVIPGYGRWND